MWLRRNVYPLNMDSNWQLDGVNNESSMGLISADDSTAVCQANILESSTMWDQASGSQNLGFSNVHHNESSSNVLGDRLLGSLGSLRDSFDSITGLTWGSPNGVLKGSMCFPGASGVFFPQSLHHFPADTGFIERAARYACFSGGNSGLILSTFNSAETSNTDIRALAPVQRSQESFVQTRSQPIFGETVQKNKVNEPESSKHVCLSSEPRVSEVSVPKNEKNNVDDPNTDSEEAGFSGQCDQLKLEEVANDSSIGVGLKKRKRNVQDSKLNRDTGFTDHQEEELEKKGKQNLSPNYIGKDCKQGSQASDSPKEEYIHVRARQGQATNSHSLAERVRREKISERMKYLQDLVPGCRKVTGKAVMLDEIINYVQSLQRQVEFLSMKLATVNPQLDCTFERLLTEDLRACSSSSLPFQTDLPMGLPFHQSQGIAQTSSIQVLSNHAGAIQRSMDLSLTGGFREPSSHVNTTWGDELHNAIQMELISTTPLISHDIMGSLPVSHTKDDI